MQQFVRARILANLCQLDVKKKGGHEIGPPFFCAGGAPTSEASMM